jgi:hypothetical protein
VARNPVWHQTASFKNTVQGNANREDRRLGVFGEQEPFITSFETQFGNGDWQITISLFKDLTRFRKSIVDTLTHTRILGPLSWEQEGCLL